MLFLASDAVIQACPFTRMYVLTSPAFPGIISPEATGAATAAYFNICTVLSGRFRVGDVSRAAIDSIFMA